MTTERAPTGKKDTRTGCARRNCRDKSSARERTPVTARGVAAFPWNFNTRRSYPPTPCVSPGNRPFFRLACPPPVCRIDYHAAENITAIFIADWRSSYLSLLLNDSPNLRSLILLDLSSLAPSFLLLSLVRNLEDVFSERIWGSGINYTVVTMGHGLPITGGMGGWIFSGTFNGGWKDGVLKRAYFIALIMNEDPLSPPATTTNTGIRYLNCDAVERRKARAPLGLAGGGGATMKRRNGGSNRRRLLSNSGWWRRRRRWW